MTEIIHISTIVELFEMLNAKQKVQYPQIVVVDFSQLQIESSVRLRFTTGFYAMMLKKGHRNNVLTYGRTVIDFQDGNLISIAPNHVMQIDGSLHEEQPEGWGIFFHPDLLRSFSLGQKIEQYNFFSYEITESLHLSEKERAILLKCIEDIRSELNENIDIHTVNIIVTALDHLLSYCARFYDRQFITRKNSNHNVVQQIEKLMKDYFGNHFNLERGLPSVQYFADKVNLSSGYLSDLLKKETGKNTQDHIHYHLIEQAKNILLGTNDSVNEVAFSLGFEYPQYFSKLFKQKTGMTPYEFRNLN